MGVDRKMDEKTGTLRKQRGRASVVFENPPLIMAAASTVGKKEGDGPLGVFFDRVELDPMLGKAGRRRRVSFRAGRQVL